MSTASLTTSNRANFDTAGSCGNRRRALRLNADVMQKARDLFPVKTALHLSEITGYSQRAVESWLSGKVVLPADALAVLMKSEWGRGFLTTVMVENTWRWWLQLQAWWDSVDIATAQIKYRRKLRKLLDDEAQSTSTVAMLLQDEAFYSGQPSPPRALAKRGK